MNVCRIGEETDKGHPPAEVIVSRRAEDDLESSPRCDEQVGNKAAAFASRGAGGREGRAREVEANAVCRRCRAGGLDEGARGLQSRARRALRLTDEGEVRGDDALRGLRSRARRPAFKVQTARRTAIAGTDQLLGAREGAAGRPERARSAQKHCTLQIYFIFIFRLVILLTTDSMCTHSI